MFWQSEISRRCYFFLISSIFKLVFFSYCKFEFLHQEFSKKHRTCCCCCYRCFPCFFVAASVFVVGFSVVGISGRVALLFLVLVMVLLVLLLLMIVVFRCLRCCSVREVILGLFSSC